MRLLYKLFGNKKSDTSLKSNETTKILPVFKNTSLSSCADLLMVHPDIKDLIWIGDGSKKNYTNRPQKTTQSTINGISITFSFGIQEEPSLLYLKLPIDSKGMPTERPPYYPSYRELTPAQKGVYWKLLNNPYDSSIDIGYVFILYYGLERYLLTDRYEEVIDVIIKLRDVHTNKSFQSYSANAIILMCLYHQRADIVGKFMQSLDKEYELNFSANLFLLCKYSLNLTLNSKDIIRLAKSFEFTKTNYIKNFPDLFEELLTSNISKKFSAPVIQCANLISNAEFRKLPKQEVPLFSNISIQDKSICIPLIVTSFHFKKDIYDLLNKTHEEVKVKLAQIRKSGVETPGKETVKKTNKKELPSFDISQEKVLLSEYKSATNNSLNQHFALIALQDFYYKYRVLDDQYLQQCISYCEEDISKLSIFQSSYIKEEQKRLQSYLPINEVQQQLRKMGPFKGNIPAFKRMTIIYEKSKQFTKGIDMCDQAIQYYSSIGSNEEAYDFSQRKEKLIQKQKKFSK